MYYILFSIMLLVLAALHVRYLEWARRYPLYVIFILITGLLNHAISHSLVINQYLEFPWRFLPQWTHNNIVYDLLLLPAFGLLLIEKVAVQEGKRLGVALFFSIFISLLDYLVVKNTDLLVLHQWTLTHTLISAFIIFYFWTALYIWLKKHINS